MKFTTKKTTTEEVEMSFPLFLKEKRSAAAFERIAIMSEKEVITIRDNGAKGCLFYSILFTDYIPPLFEFNEYDVITEDEFWKEFEKTNTSLGENINRHRPLSV